MPVMSRPQISTPLAGLMIGLAAGLVDAALVFGREVRGAGIESGSALLACLAILAPWMTVCTLAGLLFSWPRLGRLRWLVLVFSGPGLLLLSRAAPPLKDLTGWPVSRVMVLWLLANLILTVPLSVIPLVRSRASARWWSGALLTLVVLMWLAADLRLDELVAGDVRGAKTPGKPNVALIFLDTTRYDDALGVERGSMPELARFAAGAASFENAWAPAPWTGPSHRAVLTGLDPWRSTPDDTALLLSQRFRRRGYATAAIFSNSILQNLSGGFDEFVSSRSAMVCRSGIGALMWRSASYGGPAMPLCGMMDARQVSGRALRFIRRTKGPWFLAVNYLDPHDPYYVPRRCRDTSFRRATRGQRLAVGTARQGGRQASEEARRIVHDQYRAAVRCMDASLGLLLDELLGDPDAVVAVVGDHGEQFGEHGMGAHGNSVYRQVLHVPLVLRVPGAHPARIAEAVSITDLHDSILAAVEPETSRGPIPLLHPPARRPVISQYLYTSGLPGAASRGAFSLVAGRYHLIVRSDGTEELYDHAFDPAEERPIAPASAPDVSGSMREALLREQRQQRAAPEFKALGYMQ